MKQRLVGAVVLIALGIVIWPIVFDPSVVRRFSEESKIPPAPRFDEFAVPESESESKSIVVESAQAAVKDAPITSENRAAESSARVKAAAQAGEKTDEFGLPVLWAVQVGAFENQANALDLQKKLEQAGYHVILRSMETENGWITRLFVDPKMEKASAERVRKRIQQEFGRESLVVSYAP